MNRGVGASRRIFPRVRRDSSSTTWGSTRRGTTSRGLAQNLSSKVVALAHRRRSRSESHSRAEPSEPSGPTTVRTSPLVRCRRVAHAADVRLGIRTGHALTFLLALQFVGCEWAGCISAAPKAPVRAISASDLRLTGCRKVIADDERQWTCISPPKRKAYVWVRSRADTVLEANTGDKWQVVDDHPGMAWARVRLPPRGLLRLRLAPEDRLATICTATTAKRFVSKDCRPLEARGDPAHHARRLLAQARACPDLKASLGARAEALLAAACQPDEALRIRNGRLYGLVQDPERRLEAVQLASESGASYVDVDAEAAWTRMRMLAFRDAGQVDRAAELIEPLEATLAFVTDPDGIAYALTEMLAVFDQLGIDGRARDLRARLENLLDELDPETQAFTHLQLGWSYFVEADGCRGQGCSPSALAQDSARHSRAAVDSKLLLEGDGCEAATNLVLAVRLLDDAKGYEQASEALVGISTACRNPDWVQWLKLDQRPPGAARLSALRDLARRTEDERLAQRILFELSQEGIASHRFERAIEDLRTAEGVLREWVRKQEPSAARFDLRKRYDLSQQVLVDLLVDAGRVPEAFEEARRARRNVVERTLERRAAREDRKLVFCSPKTAARLMADPWPPKPELPLPTSSRSRSTVMDSELATVSEETALLLLWRGRTNVHAFLQRGDRTQHVELEKGGRAGVLRALRRFAPSLREAKALLVLATAETADCSVDTGACPQLAFHRLPHPTRDGVALGETLLVGRMLDLPPRPTSPSSSARALVFVDGFSPELERTTDHFEVTTQALKDTFQMTARRRGTAPEIASALTEVAYFHFFGHADSVDGQPSLRVGPGVHLSTLELLESTAPGPRRAALLGCGTGSARRLFAGATLGPAQALLLRGADAIIATRRPIPEHVADEFSKCLYQGSTEAEALTWFAAANQRCRHLKAATGDFFVIVP